MAGTFLILVAGSLAIAGLLTPALYSAIEASMDTVPWPYSRVFNRVWMASGLVLIWAMRKQFDTDEVRRLWREERNLERSRRIALGTGLAFFSGLLAFLFILRSGAVLRRDDTSSSEVVLKTLWTVPGALFVSALEESLFRVLVLRGFQRMVPWVLAAAASSLFYALLHFFSPVSSFEYPGYSPLVGFDYLAIVAERYLLPEILPGVLGLFLVGMVLCVTLRRTGSLSLCIGLHAGWFLIAKLGVFASTLPPGHAGTRVGRRYFMIGQPGTWVSVLVVGLFVYCLATPAQEPASSASNEALPGR